MENIKVSIVVPVYNTERYLYRCLKSIRGQTLKEIEIILVNDGSEDCSGEICNKYAAEDDRIHVIHKANGGSTSARQAGLAISSGEYVGFVDSDDWVESDMYRTLYKTAIDNRADIVAEGVIDEIGNEYCIKRNQLSDGKYETARERNIVYRNMISCMSFFSLGIWPYLWNKLIHRELALLHINGIPRSIRVGEDAAAVYPMLVHAGVIVVSDKAHYHYCRRNTSLMLGEKQEDQEYESVVQLHSFLKKRFKELGVYNLVREQLWRYTANNLLTRVYGKFAGLDRESILFPFPDISQGDSLIVYGAGAFGKAVYEYAISCSVLKVKAWVDQWASAYQSLGWDVRTLENVDIEIADKVVIAVFCESLYREIREILMIKGIMPNQIKWIDIEKILHL